MELEFQDTFFRDEELDSEPSFKQGLPVLPKRKNKVQDEKPPEVKEKEAAETVAEMLIHTYDGKLYGEDDTSQPTSRAAPIIPLEARKKKRRRRSQITICLTNCRYESIRKVASAFGMRETSEEEAWNFYWTDMSVSVERAKEMKRFQRINHFPGMLEICRSELSICLTNCAYKLIRSVADSFGMREVAKDEPWNFYWTDMSINIEKAKEMKRFQRINHFPGMLEICRKDLLARNLNRMQKIYPKEYNFFPKTWCFPADFGEALNYSKARKNKTFIIKPECGSQGRGIYLTKSLKDIKPTDKLICQVYLAKPYLVDGYKFDIRVYTLITSCDPLRIFVYNEGLVRFATSRYADPNVTNTTNVFMHLTNYALNKHSRTYVYDSEAGSKRKISTLNKILVSQGVDLDRLWHSIDQVIVKTIISAWPILKHSYHACFPSHDMVHACFEILGFDILLDHKLHPYILEVNHSPSFHTDTQLDREVKESLLTDTFTMLNIWQCDKRRVLEEDRKRIRDRLLQTNKYSEYTPIEERLEPEKSPWQTQIQWEETHLGNFRRVYPVGEQYASLFQQPSGSLYTATAASRARGDCTRQQQQEFQQQKAKAEAMKKPSQNKEKKAGDEVSADTNTTEKTEIKKENDAKPKEVDVKSKKKELLRRPTRDERSKSLSAKPSQAIAPAAPEIEKEQKPTYVLCSYEPDPIVEKDERERVNLLAQRDFLIRSYGMLEQIYLVMKKMGTLRPEDERKYGVYGRLAVVSSTPKIAIKKSKNPVTHRPLPSGDWADVLRVECLDAALARRAPAARRRSALTLANNNIRDMSPPQSKPARQSVP